MDRMEAYLLRRVKALLAEDRTPEQVVQQLQALSTTKKIQELVKSLAA